MNLSFHQYLNIPLSYLLTCLHLCNNICCFRSWYEKIKQDIAYILGIIIGKYHCNQQSFFQKLSRAEAYFPITPYVTLLYLLLWRRVKKNTSVIEGRWITMQTEMVNTRGQEGEVWGVRAGRVRVT